MENNPLNRQASLHRRFGWSVGAAFTVYLASLAVGTPLPAAAAPSTAAPEVCFSPVKTTATGSGAAALVAGDFFNHHNGTLDAVTGNSALSGGAISVLRGNGDGTF